MDVGRRLGLEVRIYTLQEYSSGESDGAILEAVSASWDDPSFGVDIPRGEVVVKDPLGEYRYSYVEGDVIIIKEYRKVAMVGRIKAMEEVENSKTAETKFELENFFYHALENLFLVPSSQINSLAFSNYRWGRRVDESDSTLIEGITYEDAVRAVVGNLFIVQDFLSALDFFDTSGFSLQDGQPYNPITDYRKFLGDFVNLTEYDIVAHLISSTEETVSLVDTIEDFTVTPTRELFETGTTEMELTITLNGDTVVIQ